MLRPASLLLLALCAGGCAALSLRMATRTYDYIVVGGGTAGSVLAARLGERNKRVLVLEAGKKPAGLEVAAPAALTKLFNSDIDWSFESRGEAHTNDRGVYLCRGKALGGSSNTNAMLYNRGAKSDFDLWEAVGGREWGVNGLLKYYRRSEDFEDGETAFHGAGGPVSVSTVPYQNPMSRAYLESCRNLGFKPNDDFDDWSKPQEGFGRFRVVARNGRRCSAHVAYMRDAMRRRNVRVETDALATRVLFDAEQRAVGVEYTSSSQDRRQTAMLSVDDGAEVLLSAGAVASPQLLMLSGVGPADHLKGLGIPIVSDQPGVGEGLRDQPACLVSYNVGGASSITDHIFRRGGAGLRVPTLLNFLLRGKGALTSPGCDHGGFFFSSEEAKGRLREPDLQLRFVAGRGDSPDGVKAYENLGKGGHVASGVTFQCIAARPRAKGRVRLRSTDPFAAPAITTNFLDNEEDRRTLRDGMRLAERIATEGSIGAAGGGLTSRVFPSDAHGDLEGTTIGAASDEELDRYIAETVHSANAVVGTCAMGAVVDNKLRVNGVKGLRVVDASVMPAMPGSQMGSHVFMIAEKAADLLTESAVRNEVRTVELRPPAAPRGAEAGGAEDGAGAA